MECVVPGLRERPPDRTLRHHAFCDPSGGQTDSFTLCIAHNDIARRTVILDCIARDQGAVLPENVVAEFSQLLKSYNVLRAQRRPLRQGMAGGVVPPPRHPLRAGRPAQERSLCRGVAAVVEQPADRAVRLTRADRPNLQLGTLDPARRRRPHRPSGARPRRSGQRGCGGGGDVQPAPPATSWICPGCSTTTRARPQAPARPSPIPSGWSLEDFERRTRPISPLPSEYLPAGMTEAFARARLDALRRAHLPANGGGSNGQV